ncbi:hypothetical protein GCM10020229_14840 [Kitasatospora albolonga]
MHPTEWQCPIRRPEPGTQEFTYGHLDLPGIRIRVAGPGHTHLYTAPFTNENGPIKWHGWRAEVVKPPDNQTHMTPTTTGECGRWSMLSADDTQDGPTKRPQGDKPV